MARRGLPPRGLRASVLEVGGESVVVLSHPIDEPELQGLTEAETDVRRLLVQGSSYAAIAKLRGTSVATVRKQVHALYTKLGVSSRRELIAASVPPGRRAN